MKDAMGRETKRKSIDGLHGIELVMVMAEGNPGAVGVMTTMIRERGSVIASIMIRILDMMNIRGSQIWVAYKDYAGSDMNRLVDALSTNDSGLIAKVNEECSSYGELATVADTTEKGEVQ